ncbi:MAG TPA: hypothetical protein VF074_10115 [Pyrinomonadaceae bacterium]
MREQEILKDENQQELADLELAEEQADTTKAGTGTHGTGGGGGAGKATFQDLHLTVG